MDADLQKRERNFHQEDIARETLAKEIMAASRARHIANQPLIEAERERRRCSVIYDAINHIRVMSEQRREALIASFKGEIPVSDQFLGEAGGDTDIGSFQGKHEFSQEDIGGGTPQLQFLNFLIDVLCHAESPLLAVMETNSSEDAVAHRSNAEG